MLALALVLCATGLVCGVLACCVKTVTVTDDAGGQYMLMTALKDPRELVELADLSLDENDSAFYTPHETGQARLDVRRAFPVEILADGNEYIVEVSTGSVEQALEKAGVEMDAADFTEPSLDTNVTREMEPITVHRVEYEDEITQEAIPFETEFVEQVDDPDGAYVHEILQSEGVEGVQQVTRRSIYVDGVYQDTQVIDTQVIEEPVNEVYVKLTTNVVSPLMAPEGYTIQDGVPVDADGNALEPTYTMKATGYSSSGGKGASGLGLFYGSIAVDPTLIPYGTKVYIVSTDGSFVYGWAIATDTGAFIHTNRMQVDLFYETYEESVENGVKEVYVYVPPQDESNP
ncbi:3D domain-containing protein [uncultured Ruthenibacterium sp.]|uniref:3D domain-containing protein n=1 Tax=uncultured Ruthenibacterium sp. TaxID=1905347 RepID=UPI00349EC174